MKKAVLFLLAALITLGLCLKCAAAWARRHSASQVLH